MRSVPVDRIVFVASLAVLAWLHGFATSARQWFPNDLLDQAWDQAQAMWPFRPPIYLHERIYGREGAQIVEPEALQPGLTLITSAWGSPGDLTPGLRLIDRQGEVLHEWRIDPTDAFSQFTDRFRPAVKDFDLQGTYLFPNGDVLVNLEYAGTLRLDACGNVLWRLQAGNHHSIARAEDGSFWIPAVTPSPRRESPAHPDGFPGIERPVYQDQILRVTEDGTVLETINVLDVLYANGLEWLLAEEDRLRDVDPTHLNDVEPLPDSLAAEYPLFEGGDLVVSLRALDLVFVLDPETERVKWHAAQHLIRQHDPDFIGGGWIGVFDNRWDGTRRGTMLGGSRILAFQPHTDSMRVWFPTPRSEPFYTPHRGKWQRLDNGNLLLTEEAAGRIVEVAPDGRTVWEWVAAPYEASDVAAVTKGTRVDVTPADVASWPCAASNPLNDREELPS